MFVLWYITHHSGGELPLSLSVFRGKRLFLFYKIPTLIITLCHRQLDNNQLTCLDEAALRSQKELEIL